MTVAGNVFTAADISHGYAVGLGRFLGCEDRLDPVVGDYAVRLADRPAFQRAISKGQLPSARREAFSELTKFSYRSSLSYMIGGPSSEKRNSRKARSPLKSSTCRSHGPRARTEFGQLGRRLRPLSRTAWDDEVGDHRLDRLSCSVECRGSDPDKTLARLAS